MKSSAAFLGGCAAVLLFFSSAQAQHSSSQASSRAKKSAPAAAPDSGTISDGVYRNRFFGFSYKFPFGWVDRTDTMQEGSEPGKSLVLLAVFERPPEVTAEGVNSGVVIAAESVASYPGLKTAADYFGPLTEVAASKGFKVADEPYEFAVGIPRPVSHKTGDKGGAPKEVVRGDFAKQGGYQSTLAWLQSGYVVSATFIGANEDEVDGFIEGLRFGK